MNSLLKIDLNTVSSDLIQEILLYLTVEEISALCRLGISFNTACQRECLWKSKVWIDYGMKKMYGKTWKETAKNLSDARMINLNKKWYNDKTYNQILDESIEEGKYGWPYVNNLRKDALNDVLGKKYMENGYWSYVLPKHVVHFSDNQKSLLTYGPNSKSINRDMKYSLDDLENILTKELLIIQAVAFINQQWNGILPGSSTSPFEQSEEDPYLPPKFYPIVLFDFNLYVIQFSSYTINMLIDIIYGSDYSC